MQQRLPQIPRSLRALLCAGKGREILCQTRIACRLVFCMSAASCCHAQEIPRASLAGAESAAARQTAQHLTDPVFQLGPTTWSAGAAVGLQASDNIRLEATSVKPDLAAQPELHARMLWPISEHNALNLNLRTGYSVYLEHSEFNRFYIGPESQLAFDLFVGDWRITLREQVSLLENNYQDPTVVGSGDYSQLENSVGAI